MVSKGKIVACVGLSLCFMASCQNKEKITEKPQDVPQIAHVVQGAGNAWKAIRLIAKNKKDASAKGKEFEVEINGEAVPIPNSTLKIKAEEFFPDFFMDGQNKAASKSASLNNPAVRISVEENGKITYRGWLFANYPDVHEFPNENISIHLKDYVKK